jgi:hypothetical protein
MAPRIECAVWLFTILTVAWLIIARGSDRLLHAQLLAEDGSVFFAVVYNLGLWEALTQPYNGGYNLLLKLLAQSLHVFRLEIIPHVFVLCALFIQVFSCCFFLSRRFAWIVPSVLLRALFCVILALLPSADEVLLRFLCMQFYLMIVAVLLLVAERPRRFIGVMGDVAVWIFLGLSIAQVIAFGPALIARSFLERGNRTGPLLAGGALIGLGILLTQANVTSVLGEGMRFAPLATSIATINALSLRVIFLGLFSSQTTYALFWKTGLAGFAYLAFAVFAVTTAMVSYRLWRSRDWRNLALAGAIVYSIIVPLWVTFGGRPGALAEAQNINTAWASDRYFVVSLAAFYMGIFLLAVRGQCHRPAVNLLRWLPMLLIARVVCLDFHVSDNRFWFADCQWPLQARRIAAAEASGVSQSLLIPIEPSPMFTMTLNVRASVLTSLDQVTVLDREIEGGFESARREYPSQGTNSSIVPQGEPLRALGWAFQTDAKCCPAEVLIVDEATQQILAQSRLGRPRHDIASRKRDGRYLRSGWEVVMPSERLEPGERHLMAYAYDPQTRCAMRVPGSVSITVVER